MPDIKALAKLSPPSSADSGEKFASKITEVIGRTQLLAAVGLRSQFPCWLLAWGLSQLLEASHIPSHVASSIVKLSNGTQEWSHSYASARSDCSFCHQLEKALCF